MSPTWFSGVAQRMSGSGQSWARVGPARVAHGRLQEDDDIDALAVEGAHGLAQGGVIDHLLRRLTKGKAGFLQVGADAFLHPFAPVHVEARPAAPEENDTQFRLLVRTIAHSSKICPKTNSFKRLN